MSSAHEWAVCVIGVVLMVVRTITEACRASVTDTLIIRNYAFASDTGVTGVVTWSVLTTGNAFHISDRNGRVVSTTIRMIATPIFPLHHADYAPQANLLAKSQGQMRAA